MLAPSTSAASSALAGGKTNARPSRAARQVIASAPRTGRSSPLSESSPANSYFEKPSASSWREAARMPSAIGRSNRPLSFGSSAGARLTVMRRAGNSKREFTSAARTRSRLSFTSVSGRPTMVNEGRPFARCTSTVTSGASSPESARLWSTASDIAGLFLSELRLEFGDAGFQLGKLFPGAGEHLGLDLEFLTRRQVQLGESRRKQRPQVLFHVLGGTCGKEIADSGAQVFEYAGLGHRDRVVGRV